jgi:hypothetical protein
VCLMEKELFLERGRRNYFHVIVDEEREHAPAAASLTSRLQSRATLIVKVLSLLTENGNRGGPSPQRDKSSSLARAVVSIK